MTGILLYMCNTLARATTNQTIDVYGRTYREVTGAVQSTFLSSDGVQDGIAITVNHNLSRIDEVSERRRFTSTSQMQSRSRGRDRMIY